MTNASNNAPFLANLDASTVAVVAVRTDNGWSRKQFASEVLANAYAQRCFWRGIEAHVLLAPVAAPVVVAPVVPPVETPARTRRSSRIEISKAPAIIVHGRAPTERIEGQVYFIAAGSDGRYRRCRFHVEVGSKRVATTGHCKTFRNAEIRARIALAKYLRGR